MKIALIHDYLNEFGGAERVLLALAEIWPEAPIYTAFYRENSETFKRLKNRKIIASWAQKIPFFATKLYSPFRFLAPLIWSDINRKLQGYDVIISSSSWYITKGFGSNEFCYCHTPPRWLYGYATSQDLQKYWLVRVYASIVGYFMRHYDFLAAQKVKYFIANSEEVKRRIEKFYRRDSVVIYPPAILPKPQKLKRLDYYLIVSRPVGGKGIELGLAAAKKCGFKLKIVGGGSVSDEELVKLYSQAKAFLALSKDEDFGITPVEAMACGTPVIAFNGGGYKETVIDGKTGILFNDYSVKGLIGAIKKFDDSNHRTWRDNCIKQAKKFSKARFKREIREFVEEKCRNFLK
jgi:glycosyltransferase involved in cell wall biosynthesis